MRTHQAGAAAAADRAHPIGADAESFAGRKASGRGANRLADWASMRGKPERVSQVIEQHRKEKKEQF